MTAFDYSSQTDTIRDDISDAHRRAWAHIASPGSWLTGVERVAVAEETRRARSCALCREHKAALSPFAVPGEHDHAGVLSSPLVDMIHRVVTDAGRLTSSWYRSLLADGLSAESYVEALGVVVLVVSVDEFHHALGMQPEAWPAPVAGDPSGYRPQGAEVEDDAAWVPILAPSRSGPNEADLFAEAPGNQAPNVIRALSLVPDEVRAWLDLSGVQYLSPKQMTDFNSPRAIDRSQIELVAGRVSALNECFY